MATPKTLFQKILISFSQMFSGNIIMSATSIISSYFFALFLGPYLYGIWQTALVILGYGVIIELGLPFIFRRDYVFLQHDGKMKEAQNMSNLLFTYSLIIRLISTVLIYIYAYVYIDNEHFRYSMYLISVLFIVGLPISFGNIMSKGLNQYGKITWQKSINGLGLLITIPFVYLYGYNSLLIGFLFTNILVAVYYYLYRPVKFGFYWNFNLFKKMAFSAFPLFLVSIVSVIFISIDRLIIASMLGYKQVGFYSLSRLLSNPLNITIGAISIVLFTRLNEAYGATINKSIINKHVIIPQSFFSNLLPIMIGIGLLALPLLVKLLLPKYSDGILAAQINIFATYFYLMTSFSSNALFVANKQKYIALSFLFSGLVKVGLSILLIKGGYGITGVAFASVVAYLFYDVLMLKIIFNIIELPLKEYFKHIIKVLIPVLIPIVFIVVATKLSRLNIHFSNHNPFVVLLEEILFIIAMFPFIRKLYLFVSKKIKNEKSIATIS